MLPYPPGRACEQVRGPRLKTQGHALPDSIAFALSEAEPARRSQGESHHVAEDGPILMPTDRRTRRIFGNPDLLQFGKGKPGRGPDLSAKLVKKWRDWICR